jgi:predicted ATPase
VISSVEITRFRGIREGKLEDLTPLVVLTGPNGCGKSSVLDALLVAGSRLIKSGIAQAVRRHEGLQYGARWLYWRPRYHHSSVIRIETSPPGERTCALSTQDLDECDPFAVTCQIGQNLAGVQGNGDIFLEFNRGNTIGRSGGQEPHTRQKAFGGVRLLESHREDPAVPLHELVTKTTETGTLREVLAIVAQVVSGAKDVRILTEANEPLVHIVYDDHSVPAALAGDGVYSLLRLCLELASLPKGTVLLEEPEVHQHPGAIRQTMRAVLAAVRRDIQVVLTTHSLELIDLLLAEASDEDIERLSLYRLDLHDGCLISRRVPGSEVAFSRCEVEKDLR